MHAKLLSPRPGFTLAEVLVAMTLTAVIGSALVGVFVSQSRFFDDQEKTVLARSVSRGAVNVVMSELRMLERDSALIAPATTKKITVRVPYALGVFCGMSGGHPVVSLIPADTMTFNNAGHTGYAYRSASNGRYTYVASQREPEAAAICTSAGVRTFTDSAGRVMRMPTAPPLGAPALTPGSPVLLYHRVTYEFAASVDVPGTTALWRTVVGKGDPEELVAPFDSSARFGFYVNDAVKPDSSQAPANLASVTGIQLVLNGLTEGPKPRVQPVRTSVFFRNR